SIITQFPQQIQNDYNNAVKFSQFVYALRVVYNIIVSNGKNENANAEWEKIKSDLCSIADIGIQGICDRLNVNNSHLICFLENSKSKMESGDIDGLKEQIINREVYLKGSSRAKTKHAGELDASAWYGGKKLDYRFPDAKRIMIDIFKGGLV
ncbi:MAG: hypothetical protein IJY70_05380, partial [Clostridia bacterium]|nr:hypothetical protein [Clostridia bacterium]